MASADRVETRQNCNRVKEDSVDSNWSALVETNGDFFGLIGSIFGRSRKHEEIGRGWLCRIFENSALVRDVPDIAVARIDLLSRCRNGNVVFRSVLECVCATLDVPLTPGGDDWKVRCERGISQLETNLVVSLAGAAVGKRICTNSACHFNLTPRNERAPHRSAEEVFTTVDRACAQRRPDEILNEFLAKVFDVAFVGA